MILNLLIGLPEDVHNELNQGRNDENSALSDLALRFSRGQLDPDTVQNLYKTHTQGQTVRHLWSIILTAEDHNDVVSQVNSFRQEYPGARVLGLWKQDGAMYGCELVITDVPNPAYVGEPEQLSLVDEFGYETFIPNPAWVPEFLYVRSQTGMPQYDPQDLSPYMPDGYDEFGNPVPDPTVRDVNLPSGFAERVFA